MIRLFICFLTLAISIFATNSFANDHSTSKPVKEKEPHVLFVLTNQDVMGHTGEPTGYWLSEVAHPWAILSEAGFRSTFASINGGKAPVAPRSVDKSDSMNVEFLNGPVEEGLIDNTVKLSSVDLTDVDVIFFVGGNGTMWDFPANEVIGNAIIHTEKQNDIVAAVCHGPAAFVGVVDEDGKPFIEGKKVADFTNDEEEAVERKKILPFLLETRLKELGAEFIGGENFQENYVKDGKLVTGQNPASAEGVAHEIIKMMSDYKD